MPAQASRFSSLPNMPNKTRPEDTKVTDFLSSLVREDQKADAFQLLELFSRVTHEQPVIWGGSMVGFGMYHYTYESGRSGNFFMTGFAPRKQNISIYILPGFDHFPSHLNQLGKYTTGKSCLYIKRLSDVNLIVLEDLIKRAYGWMKDKYPVN